MAAISFRGEGMRAIKSGDYVEIINAKTGSKELYHIKDITDDRIIVNLLDDPDLTQIIQYDKSVGRYVVLNDPNLCKLNFINGDLDMPGNASNRYNIIETLGKGAFGIVYRVKVSEKFSTPKHDFEVGEEYAMKVFKGGVNNSIGGDVIREIDILNRLDQENVMFACDTFAMSDGVGGCEEIRVVLPLALGDLHQYIKQERAIAPMTERGPLAPLKMFFDILCGVYYLHSNFIIHDDLKPANILLFDRRGRTDIGKWKISHERSTGEIYYYDPRRKNSSQFEKPIDRDFDLQPRIADYGISKFAGDMEDVSGTSQSLWWKPPEILESLQEGLKNRHSYESDIWALGTIFYELTTGENPFAAVSEDEVLGNIRKFSRSRLWMNLPQFKGEFDGLQYLIHKMLDPIPSSRITAEEALSDPLFAMFGCPRQAIGSIPWNMESSITDSDRKKAVKGISSNVRRLSYLAGNSTNRADLNGVELLAIDIFDRITSDQADCIKDEKYETTANVSFVLAAKIFNMDRFIDYDDKDLINLQCQTLECLNWTPFRPLISSIFPDVGIDDLMKCYHKSRSHDQIRVCVDEYQRRRQLRLIEYERQEQLRGEYKPSGIFRNYVNEYTGQEYVLDVGERALKPFKLDVDQQVFVEALQQEAKVIGVIDGEIYVTYDDHYGDEEIAKIGDVYDYKGLRGIVTPL
jgi:serine/threonine protein kinase